jgi:hypothetical protein
MENAFHLSGAKAFAVGLEVALVRTSRFPPISLFTRDSVCGRLSIFLPGRGRFAVNTHSGRSVGKLVVPRKMTGFLSTFNSITIAHNYLHT